MWSGKTSTMCGAVERYYHAGKRCVIVKYAKDVRYNHLARSGGIVTHRGDEYCKVPIIETEVLADVLTDCVDVIGVDEAQFFPDSPEYIRKWAELGLHVIAAALDSTWQGKPFPRVAEIIAMSDRATKLLAVCMQCGADAPFTCKIAGTSNIEEIGGTGKYLAVCRQCFNQHVTKPTV